MATGPYSNYSPYGASYTGYGGTPGYGGYTPYNRYNSMMSPYGTNRYGSNYYGGTGVDAMNPYQQPTSLTSRMEASSRSTFELIENIVNAFAGFAQMLESTYMAAHSGFMAVIGVADSFHALKQYFGRILEVFAIWRYLKRVYMYALLHCFTL